MNIDPEQPIDCIRVLLERVAEDREAGVHHQHVERSVVAHAGDHRVPVGAVRQDGHTPGLGRQLLGRLGRTGVGEGHTSAFLPEAPHDRGPDAATAAEHQNGFSFERCHMTLLEFYLGSAT